MGDFFKFWGPSQNYRTLRHCEKATKLEKNLPLVLTKQPYLLSSVKTSWNFFSNFCGLLRKAELYLQDKFDCSISFRNDKQIKPYRTNLK